MPTPAQSQQNARLLESRIETQEQRLDDLAQKMDKNEELSNRRMEKYDEIINDLRTIVIALKAKDDATAKNNQRWINGILMVIMIGATIIGAVIGVVASHLIH